MEKKLPIITEKTTLKEIFELYPHAPDFLEARYGISASDSNLSLNKIAKKYSLPASQILFAEIQLHERTAAVKVITPRELNDFLGKSKVHFMDIREEWELHHKAFENALRLTPESLEFLRLKPLPIVVYCHFGIRSLDAAVYLADQGINQVYVLKGGIDAWAAEIDHDLPRYDGSPC